MTIQRSVALLMIASLAACGGGGGGAAGSSITPHTAPQLGSATITLKVPARSAQLRPREPHSLRPLYDSPATMGLGLGIAAAPATPPPVGTPTYAFDLSTCSAANGCTANADGSRTYQLTTPITLPFGTYNVNISTWDAAPSGGTFTARRPAHPITGPNELSYVATSVAISAINTNIPVVLNGIPASVTAVPLEGQSHVLNDGAGDYDLIGNTPTQWDVTALDSDGYIIAGDGAPMMTFADPTNLFRETNLNASAPSNAFTIAAIQAQNGTEQLTITATGIGPAGPVTAQGSVFIEPDQELWETVSGTGTTGLFGYRIIPNGSPSYAPPNNCCSQVWFATDTLASADAFGAVAQDSSGALWVYDATTNTIDQYTPSASGPPTLGTTISVSGKTIVAMAGDANGFLYAIDSTANAIDTWKVVGATPSSTPTFTTVVNAANALGVSIAPANYPGVAGDVAVADANTVEFYSNATSGTPSLQTVMNPTAGPGISVGFAPDAQTMWTLTFPGASTEITTYGFKAANNLTLLVSGTSAYDEGGPLAVGIAAYGYVADGNGHMNQVDVYLGGNSRNFGIGTGSGSTTNYDGALISP